tara:strand:+ start:1504 stop:2022 length:519 start_codon:yes stop_codon:yes gene_type:complete
MPKKLRDNVCEEKVFSGIYSKFSNDLLGFLYYKFNGRADCHDKMQEAFIKLWDNCKSVSPDKAKAFIFKVAGNMMLNELKHEKVVLRYAQQKPTEVSNESPEFLLEEAEFLKKYQNALSTLTENQRVAFLLFRAEGKNQKEIAEMLGVSTRVVESRIFNAYKKLKALLKEFK